MTATAGRSAARYRFLLPLADPVLGRALRITLFRASSPGAAD
jgi:hypothetical protein